MSDDDARYEYEAVVTLTFQTTADDAQKCLERSGFFGGALIGETMVDTIEIYAPDGETL